MLRFLPLLLLLTASLTTAVHAEETIGTYSKAEALRLGEQMYRKGILPSGQPIRARVMGDVPVDGRMFTCDDCHQRSGLGSEEGTIITYPINGKELFVPRRRTGAFKHNPATESGEADSRAALPSYYQVPDARPAYDDVTLARVIRTGTDSAGNKLDPIMPKYIIGKSNMDLLIFYLKNLSVEVDPGADDTTIKFATVVAGHVPDQQQEAMLSVLQTYIDAHNSQTRHEERRASSGPFYKTERNKSYRRLELDIWNLEGEKATWPQQLEKYYQEKPVFALLGGISAGDWAPIHEFSEEHRIPCILPITDLPVISDTDWYTLYFSKGYTQEAESLAKYLRNQAVAPQDMPILQVYDPADERSATITAAFKSYWLKQGGSEPADIQFHRDRKAESLAALSAGLSASPGMVLIWLDKTHGQIYEHIERSAPEEVGLVVSSTLLDHDYANLTPELRKRVLVTFPHSTDKEDEKSRMLVKKWLQVRKIPETDFTIQAEMYFLGWMLPGALKSMRSEFYRDYFLERFDMMIDQDYAIAVYPRLTFGPGQRYASKGCYIAKLDKDPPFAPIPVSDWVVH